MTTTAVRVGDEDGRRGSKTEELNWNHTQIKVYSDIRIRFWRFFLQMDKNKDEDDYDKPMKTRK